MILIDIIVFCFMFNEMGLSHRCQPKMGRDYYFLTFNVFFNSSLGVTLIYMFSLNCFVLFFFSFSFSFRDQTKQNKTKQNKTNKKTNKKEIYRPFFTVTCCAAALFFLCLLGSNSSSSSLHNSFDFSQNSGAPKRKSGQLSARYQKI